MMRDLKAPKPAKVKPNRRKRQKEPRDWKKLFHRLLRLTLVLGSATLVVSGGALAFRLLSKSDYFRVAAVRVENQRRVAEQEILALSDIRAGASIFGLDLELIGNKIEENPWIASARVERIFPQEVVVRVVEREPRAIINLGYLYYLDDSGEVFKVLEPEDALDFPVVTGVDRRLLLEQPEAARKLLAEAVALIDMLATRRVFTLDDVSEVHIDPVEGVDLYTRAGGIPVRLGHSNFEPKLDRLERIFGELEPRLVALRYIDLNVADRVIVKLDNRRGRG